MRKILTPRGYLSHTQISHWMKDPEGYVRTYIHGEERFTNANMDFGSKVATAFENGEESDDEMINILTTVFPRYSKREFELRVPLRTEKGEVDLLGKMDQFEPKTLAFRETKTGTVKWTQGRADKHPQLDQYAAMIWLKYGKLPTSINLDWAETCWDGGEVVLTGVTKSFEVKKTLSDVLAYLAIVARVAREIDERYRKELTNLS